MHNPIISGPNFWSPNTQGPQIIKLAVAFFSISFLLFGSSVLLMGHAETLGELPPQQQQQNLTSNVTASPSAQQQQQDPPITFQQREEEPCDGTYFVGPGGLTECM